MKNYLKKGINYLTYSLPLFFIGPSVIYNAFSNKQTNWHYLVLLVGIVLCLFAMYFMFYGLVFIVKHLFKDE
jgi:putative Mn2+ efflux pump MntP